MIEMTRNPLARSTVRVGPGCDLTSSARKGFHKVEMHRSSVSSCHIHAVEHSKSDGPFGKEPTLSANDVSVISGRNFALPGAAGSHVYETKSVAMAGPNDPSIQQ